MLSFYDIKSFTRALRNTDHKVSVPKCPGKWLYFINQGQLFQINYINTDFFVQLLENRSFWPRGVTCRPWVNGSGRHTSRYGEDSRSQSDQLSRHIHGRSDIDDYNPYSPLRDYHNLD